MKYMTKKWIYTIACSGILATSLLCGCGKVKSDAQEKLRLSGIEYMEKGKYGEAIEAFQKSLNESVGGITQLEIDTCYYKAEAQYLSGDIEGAFETYNALIDYKDLAKAYYLRGCLYFTVGDQKKGMSDLESAAENANKDYELYIALYETMSQYNMGDAGQVYLNKALEIGGEKPKDFLYQGRVYELLKESDKAIASLEKALEKGESKANFYMAQIYANQGDAKIADTYFKAYLESGKASSEELCSMGEMQLANKDYETAITYLKNALEVENANNRQEIMKDLIIAYESSQNFTEARKVMDDYVKEFPEDEAAKKESVFLETR